MRKKIKIGQINSIMFFIDEVNKKNIEGFLKDKGQKKLQEFLVKIANNVATVDIYGQENFNSSIKNVTAVKFKGKYFNNARIYCKDFYLGEKRIIVLSELLKSKKQNNLGKNEKNSINKVNKYDYS